MQSSNQAERSVGSRIRSIRTLKGFSLRVLAEKSGLSINTLSLIENGKTSPSVSTLQRIALALDTQIIEFFESDTTQKAVVFTKADQRSHAVFNGIVMQNLGRGITDNAIEAFVVVLKPGQESGDRDIVHSGHEFVYILSGEVRYEVEKLSYQMSQGDSLLFQSYLPHRWKNESADDDAQLLLVLIPDDKRETAVERHFQVNGAI